MSAYDTDIRTVLGQPARRVGTREPQADAGARRMEASSTSGGAGDGGTVKDPQIWDIWDAHDGGSLYVWQRTPRMVCVSRRPWRDSQAEPAWMRLTTFDRDADYKLADPFTLPF